MTEHADGRGKLPAFQFYTKDWREDLELQSCSLAAQGLWINAICIAHQARPYGHLVINGKPMTLQQIANAIGTAPRECKKLLDELAAAGVTSLAEDGAIFSRRMVRDQALREVRAAGGKAGAEHGAKGAAHGAKGGRPRKQGGDENPPSDDDGTGGEKPPLNPPPSSPSPSATPVKQGDEPPAAAPAPTARGALALRFKAVGILPEPGHADFQALADSGAQWDEFEPHITRALGTDRPFRYTVAAVIGERNRAAKRGPLPPAPQPTESAYAREQRERAEAFAPSIARRAPAPSPRGDFIEAEVTDVTPRALG